MRHVTEPNLTDSPWIEIDGCQGEGGGQMVRSSLTLSMVTGKPVRIVNIRAGRDKPGLMRQHLTCVQAAAEVSRAKVTGDKLGSTAISFEPQAVVAGEYHFRIGTAGSASLVVQTLLPASKPARKQLSNFFRSQCTVKDGQIIHKPNIT
jgi:RNA 3'-terminal phosphate cyclase (ATP)